MSVPYAGGYLGLGNSFTSQNRVVSPVGGWVELGRTTLGSAGDSIAVSSLADKRYLMLLYDLGADSATNINANVQFNSDTGSNYAKRRSLNGGADVTAVSQTSSSLWDSVDEQPVSFGYHYISNLAAKEKLGLGVYYSPQTAGAATEGNRQENATKWDNTSAAINKVDIINTSTGSYDTGSEVVVLGWDPADTHTDNFWEELGTDTGDGSSTDITATFTAKKYLWIQAFLKGTTSVVQTFRLGSSSTPDTGNNYATRFSLDGSADGTGTSQSTLLTTTWNNGTKPVFWNIFILNNASNEKLVMMHAVDGSTAGAGTAPNRSEWTAKWSNTSNQADVFEVNRASGAWTTDSIVKVWGSD